MVLSSKHIPTFINIVRSRALVSGKKVHTLLTVFRNNGIMLQKFKYYTSIMPDAPDIVLCSKLCRHNPTDPKLQRVKAAYCTCKTQVYMSMAPFSNENGAVLLRIRLSSTLQRRKRSRKTEPFENALQSGAI